ncbi:MAG: hypothetical protein Q9212_002131 [Teloschistes hypoglaucus]
MSAKEMKDVFRATVLSEGLIYHYRVYLEGQKSDICKRLAVGGFHDTPDGQAFRKGYNDMLAKVSATLREWSPDYDGNAGPGPLDLIDTESLLSHLKEQLNEQELLLSRLDK